MCLYTKQICPIKARKRIVVYKVVRRFKHKTRAKKYKTPCMKKPIFLFSSYKAEGATKVETTRELWFGNGIFINMFVVEYGYIHCCTSLEYAKNWLYKNYHLFPHNKKQPFHWGIIKCFIEPGTLYYKSFDGAQIATKSLLTREMVLKG